MKKKECFHQKTFSVTTTFTSKKNINQAVALALKHLYKNPDYRHGFDKWDSHDLTQKFRATIPPHIERLNRNWSMLKPVIQYVERKPDE